MATILIDYENVFQTYGLRGTEYLKEQDRLVIFYSNCCSKIRADDMGRIERSGCAFDVCKLARSGKNALDFYICAACGEAVSGGEKQIVIVSRDKGFSALVDYYQIKSPDPEFKIVYAPNIEQGLRMLNAPEDASRRSDIARNAQMRDLAAEQARYKERNGLKQQLADILADTGTDQGIDTVMAFVEDSRGMPPRSRYISFLKCYGRKRGIAIYNAVKRTEENEMN